jgi:hypothetical protein
MFILNIIDKETNKIKETQIARSITEAENVRDSYLKDNTILVAIEPF